MNAPSAPAGGGGGLLGGLLRIVTTGRPDADTGLIENAYDAAAHWHQGQRRKSGDPYITHPVAVAVILAEMGADDATLCAALLHDVLADTSCTPAALREAFGAEIEGLVTATMALDRASAGQLATACADIDAAAASAGDERALLIKVADRLHNMRTLRHLPRATQMRKSRQTLDVVVPLARTLRVDAIGSELESLASATLRRRGRRPGTASGHLLSALAALLPASARARWRQEWLAELHRLGTRRERLGFAIQIALGIGRLAVTLYREPRGSRD
jgi:HD domain